MDLAAKFDREVSLGQSEHRKAFQASIQTRAANSFWSRQCSWAKTKERCHNEAGKSDLHAGTRWSTFCLLFSPPVLEECAHSFVPVILRPAKLRAFIRTSDSSSSKTFRGYWLEIAQGKTIILLQELKTGGKQEGQNPLHPRPPQKIKQMS